MHVVYCSSFIDANVVIVFILYAFLVFRKYQQMQCYVGSPTYLDISSVTQKLSNIRLKRNFSEIQTALVVAI